MLFITAFDIFVNKDMVYFYRELRELVIQLLSKPQRAVVGRGFGKWKVRRISQVSSDRFVQILYN